MVYKVDSAREKSMAGSHHLQKTGRVQKVPADPGGQDVEGGPWAPKKWYFFLNLLFYTAA